MFQTKWCVILVSVFATIGTVNAIHAAPKADLWPRWEANEPSSTVRVDHGPWDRFLKKYLVTNHPSGVNRVRYGSVSPEDKNLLEDYLTALQRVRVPGLSGAEQKAYWIDLYNALTVKVILDHDPVKSILDINVSPGLFSKGPWGAKLLRIEGEQVSLNDIEHRILRPIWRDSRVHYAVNCASMSCPNLQSEAFTAENTERLLEKGAREYVNSPRGARFDTEGLTLSSIYDWFQKDFGGSESDVLEYLRKHAEGPLAKSLTGYGGKIRYSYDWSLND